MRDGGRKLTVVAVAVVAVVNLLLLMPPAVADHTDPSQPLSPTAASSPGTFVTRGAGTWRHIRNFPANPGTDLEFIKRGKALYATGGTLGQADEAHVGQRILRLVRGDGTVAPQWVADHGSANCETNNPAGTTGLQHDAQVTPKTSAQLIIDATDATGRCHDTPGGGLEFIDVSGLGTAGFEPREIHLTRHFGTSHTVTVDAKRPGIVYNSTAAFSGQNWIDVLDIRSCLGLSGQGLAAKRAACRPKVYRIPFQPEWSRQLQPDGTGTQPGSEASCHDITSKGSRLYCAALNATLIFDVSGLTSASGGVRGTPLPCTVVAGTRTGAQVTDCSSMGPNASQRAEGWRFLGSINHPGRNCGGGTTTCNSNLVVPADEGVAVSHEADPTPDNKTMFVTDERGGGIVPPGASCQPGLDNPYGNGGIHALNISTPGSIRYRLQPDGSKAVFIGEEVVPAPSFCTVHVIEHIPSEQRLSVAYYSQGTKIVDYFVNGSGRFTFRETASVVFPNANTWAVEQFKTRNNGDGTRTYFFMSTDIERGIDIFSWTGARNPIGASAPIAATASGFNDSSVDLGLLAAALVLIPAAAWVGRRRRAVGRLGWSFLLRL